MGRAGEDSDIHILSNLNGVGNVEVNAFQPGRVVVRSRRGGFRSESPRPYGRDVRWSGNVGGIPLQIVNGETGFLVNTAEECAQRCVELLRRSRTETARAMAPHGERHMRHSSSRPRPLLKMARRLHEAPGGG